MKRAGLQTALVLFFLVLGYVLPRPVSALPSPVKEARVAVNAGDDGTIVSPRPPRRRIQTKAVPVPLVLVTAPRPEIFPPAPETNPDACNMAYPSVVPPSGGGVTRAGPSILS